MIPSSLWVILLESPPIKRLLSVDHTKAGDRNALLACLDDEITRSLPSILAALRLRRNGFSSWNCLPPEIICYIMKFAVGTCGWPKVSVEDDPAIAEWDEESSDNGGEIVSYVPGWITLTHVCHRWREVSSNICSVSYASLIYWSRLL